MSKKGLPCLRCREARQRPKYVELPLLVFDPQRVMAGPMPLIANHRLSADMICAYAYGYGGIGNSEVEAYDVTAAEQIMACWWAGLYGSRKWKKRLGTWAEVAGQHLWYGCVNVPPLPATPEEARDA